MPGPLSMPCQDREKFRSLDTAAKRDDAGTFTTGKTAANHKKAHNGAQIDNAPKNLARRLRHFEAVMKGDGFHRPGSNKK